jgi:1-acyl-sn-glycerol-3-phosphate acyltransferase
VEPVFRTLEIAGRAAVRVTGTRISYWGLTNIPAEGGAVVAINHTGYVDFLPAALAAMHRGRRLRFMIKAEMQRVRIVNFLIRHSKTIPVDRGAGAGAYAVAVERLREGELVGVYPEATISRSFELKEFKTGAARMALEAHAPIVPLVVWGAHRIWTKDHPRNVGRAKIPVTVAVGAPLTPTGTADEVMGDLRVAMTSLLHEVQQSYDHPQDAYWVPRRLGGSAPTMAEARAREVAELAERAKGKESENR